MIVKALETKVNSLLREVDVIKDDFSFKLRSLEKKNNINGMDALELRRLQENLQQRTDMVIKELKQTAGQDEVAVLKKYLEYWNPMRFVTQDDLDRVLREAENARSTGDAASRVV